MRIQQGLTDRHRLRAIRCLLTDVDGVLTDGKIHLDSRGQDLKSFDIQDGHGIAMAIRGGLLVGFVSGRPSKATAARAKELGVTILHQSPSNKMEMVERIKLKHDLQNEEICFVGDELVDLPVLKQIGFAVAVPNAVAEVKRIAHHTTRRRGGDGAIREVIEMILKAQGKWSKLIAKYTAVLLAGFFFNIGLSMGSEPNLGESNIAAGFVEKFEIPERDEHGNLRWKLTGDRAEIRPDGLMNIINARAEFYTSNKFDMALSTPKCLLDQASRKATMTGPVKIERSNMVVTGIGAEWDNKTSSFVLHSNVQLVITGVTPSLDSERISE